MVKKHSDSVEKAAAFFQLSKISWNLPIDINLNLGRQLGCN